MPSGRQVPPCIGIGAGQAGSGPQSGGGTNISQPVVVQMPLVRHWPSGESPQVQRRFTSGHDVPPSGGVAGQPTGDGSPPAAPVEPETLALVGAVLVVLPGSPLLAVPPPPVPSTTSLPHATRNEARAHE